MDMKTFIVEMTKALVWPSTVLGTVLAFRKQLLRLLRERRGAIGANNSNRDEAKCRAEM
jgi:hypothetical protein